VWYVDIQLYGFMVSPLKTVTLKRRYWGFFNLCLLCDIYLLIYWKLCVCACIAYFKEEMQEELDIKSQTAINSALIHSLVLWPRTSNWEKKWFKSTQSNSFLPKKKEKSPCILFQCFLFLVSHFIFKLCNKCKWDKSPG